MQLGLCYVCVLLGLLGMLDVYSSYCWLTYWPAAARAAGGGGFLWPAGRGWFDGLADIQTSCSCSSSR